MASTAFSSISKLLLYNNNNNNNNDEEEERNCEEEGDKELKDEDDDEDEMRRIDDEDESDGHIWTRPRMEEEEDEKEDNLVETSFDPNGIFGIFNANTSSLFSGIANFGHLIPRKPNMSLGHMPSQFESNSHQTFPFLSKEVTSAATGYNPNPFRMLFPFTFLMPSISVNIGQQPEFSPTENEVDTVYSDGNACGLMGTQSMQHSHPHGNNGLIGISPHKRLGHPYQSRQPASQKKPRTSFTKAQVSLLERRFAEQKYLASADRARLATQLAMEDGQVKTWFQNRRTKWRRQEMEEREMAAAANQINKKI